MKAHVDSGSEILNARLKGLNFRIFLLNYSYLFVHPQQQILNGTRTPKKKVQKLSLGLYLFKR